MESHYSWRYVNFICDTFTGEAQSFSLSTVLFDNELELLWTGDERGRIDSYMGGDLQPYTSFCGHEGAVKSLASLDGGILSLSSQSVRLTNRRGLANWTLKGADLQNLGAMVETSNKSMEILVAGRQPQVLVLNTERGKILKKWQMDQEVLVMRRSRMVVCGLADGQISFHDPRSFSQEHKLPIVHSGGIQDLAISGNTLITCGYSKNAMLDNVVKMFDVRSFQPLSSIPFGAGAMMLRFHPKVPNMAFLVSSSGKFQLCDVTNPSISIDYASGFTGALKGADVSSSGEMLAFVDEAGIVQLWADREEPQINAYPSLSSSAAGYPEFADPVCELPETKLTDNVPLSVVGMPYYQEPLLSSWPGHMIFDIGQYVPPLELDTLPNVKMVDFVGTTRWHPGKRLRNQAPATYSLTHGGMEERSLTEDGFNQELPRIYQKVEAKYGKFGVEDFNFSIYNQTSWGGLETHNSYSYCNSLLQLLHFNRPFRQVALSHVKSNCLRSVCLLCELGFLFQMLKDSEGRICQASNFYRALTSIKQGFMEPANPDARTSYAMMIQHFYRFLLEKMEDEPLLQHLLSISYSSKLTCYNCGWHRTSSLKAFNLDLVYPNRAMVGANSSQVYSFSELLRATLVKETTFNSLCCEKCCMPVGQKKIARRLPPILGICTGGYHQEDYEIWVNDRDVSWIPKKIGVGVRGEDWVVTEFDSMGQPLIVHSNYDQYWIYELKGVISQIQQGIEVPHMVVEIKEGNEWFLFNSFSVKPIPENNVFMSKCPWKLPAILHYVRSEIDQVLDESKLIPRFDFSMLFNRISPSFYPNSFTFEPLQEHEIANGGFLCAIDAEFVAFTENHGRYRQGLARVSVIRGEEGEKEAVPFIDDYIAATEPVTDYLTEFSGIEAGDLDPKTSRHHLVSLKEAYKKLRFLVDMGCKFVGHGLRKDFRIINILVPYNQVIDTVDIFHDKSRQRFLAWYLLNENIQTTTHDSIEDARTALAIYKKSLQLKAEGRFEQTLEDIYNDGWRYNWKPLADATSRAATPLSRIASPPTSGQ